MFTHIVKPITACVILSIPSWLCWPLRQLDVSNSFFIFTFMNMCLWLNLLLYWWKQLITQLQTSKVSLLGLEMGSLCMVSTSKFFSSSIGFFGSKLDFSLFYSQPDPTPQYLFIYMDNIIVTGHNQKASPTHFDLLLLNSPSKISSRLIIFSVLKWFHTSGMILSTKEHSWSFKEDKDGGCQSSANLTFLIFLSVKTPRKTILIL